MVDDSRQPAGVHPDLTEVRARLGELDENLNGQRFSGGSRDGAVHVTSDGHGALIDLRVDDRALRSGHPELIGPAIVEAVAACRRQASAASRDQMQQVFTAGVASAAPAGPAAPAGSVDRPQSQRPSRSTRSRRQPADLDDEEPLFQGLDQEQRRSRR